MSAALGTLAVEGLSTAYLAGGSAFSGFVHIVYGALVLWGMRDRWLRSRQVGQPIPQGAPA